MKTKSNIFNISGADPGDSYFKRNVPVIIDNLKKKLKQEKSIEQHIQCVLCSSEIEKISSVGLFLNYKYNLKIADALADHDYCKNTLFDPKIIAIDPNKSMEIQTYIDKQYTISPEIIHTNNNINNNILKQNELEIKINNSGTAYEDLSNNLLHDQINSQLDNGTDILKIDLRFLKAPKPCGYNYENVYQNTEEWQRLRNYKVSGSRLPALLGLYGGTKYKNTWNIVKNGKSEPSQTHIRNIARGHYYEDEAWSYFQLNAKCKVEKCGLFHHPQNCKYGSSPDALGPVGILIEVKTRAERSLGPLNSIEKCPQYFVQCQLQMLCTNAEFCILQSYHPETKSSIFFLIKRNNTLMNIVTDVIDCIYDGIPVLEWNHQDVIELHNFGKVIVGKIPNFDLLKPLRSFIKKSVKLVPQVRFIDAPIDFERIVENDN